LLLLGWISSTLLKNPHSLSTVAAASEDVQVWVEGPWAYAPDPRTGHNGIVLIAPSGDAIDHFAPAVQYKAGDFSLSTTVTGYAQGYAEIAIKNMTSPSPCPAPCSFSKPTAVPVDKKNLISLINKPGSNYVISLPTPDYYEQAVVGESRLRYGWWKECHPTPTSTSTCGSSSNQDMFASQMILHYSVSTLAGITIDGPAHPYDFEDQRVIHIFMTPQTTMDPCDSPGRQTFLELVRLFTVKSAELLYIDLKDTKNGRYPSDSDDKDGCLDNDPQNPINQNSVTSLRGAFETLRAYLVDPSDDRLPKAQASLKWIKHYGHLVTTRQPLFDENVKSVESFLKNKRPSSSKRIKVLRNLDAAERWIPFHDGSGACLNPLLPLNPT
jgi:hypothetical protein